MLFIIFRIETQAVDGDPKHNWFSSPLCIEQMYQQYYYVFSWPESTDARQIHLAPTLGAKLCVRCTVIWNDGLSIFSNPFVQNDGGPRVEISYFPHACHNFKFWA